MTQQKMMHATEATNLADILERVLDKGIVIAGDIKVWNTYLNTVEGALAELSVLSPSKCKGWDAEHRTRLEEALTAIGNHVQKMLRALEA